MNSVLAPQTQPKPAPVDTSQGLIRLVDTTPKCPFPTTSTTGQDSWPLSESTVHINLPELGQAAEQRAASLPTAEQVKGRKSNDGHRLHVPPQQTKGSRVTAPVLRSTEIVALACAAQLGRVPTWTSECHGRTWSRRVSRSPAAPQHVFHHGVPEQRSLHHARQHQTPTALLESGTRPPVSRGHVPPHVGCSPAPRLPTIPAVQSTSQGTGRTSRSGSHRPSMARTDLVSYLLRTALCPPAAHSWLHTSSCGTQARSSIPV